MANPGSPPHISDGNLLWIGPRGGEFEQVFEFCVEQASQVALRTNIAAGLLSAGLFSLLNGWTDPLAHRIGFALLTDAHLAGIWARLYEWPLVPWTALSNTVVFGNVVLGAWLFYPAYRLSHAAVVRYRPRLVATLTRWRVTTLLMGTETVANWRAR